MIQNKIKNGFIIAGLILLSVLYCYPIVLILINSFKIETAISTSTAFQLPTLETFAGFANYVQAIIANGFLTSLFYSLIITLTSVAAILLFTSMCAWFITRVASKWNKLLYYLFAFSMVVPFQMVMFTLSSTADALNLNNPFNIWIIYLGFGAGFTTGIIGIIFAPDSIASSGAESAGPPMISVQPSIKCADSGISYPAFRMAFPNARVRRLFTKFGSSVKTPEQAPLQKIFPLVASSGFKYTWQLTVTIRPLITGSIGTTTAFGWSIRNQAHRLNAGMKSRPWLSPLLYATSSEDGSKSSFGGVKNAAVFSPHA